MEEARQQATMQPASSSSEQESFRESLPQAEHPLYSKYIIEREIGHGSQGRIFLAKRLSDNLKVAIKQLNISSIKTWKEYDLFHREATLLESVKIPGVAKFYDAIECLDDKPPCSYIVQEYIDGTSLEKMIRDGHRFKVEDVYDILIQTLQILEKLHQHEPPIIHRDIKPSNLMITPDKNGKYKVTIIDFGAVANPQVQGGGSTIAGTFGYMPPEQLTGKPAPASDIYALAALGVQLFCGKSPAELPQKDFRLIFEPELQDRPHDLVVLLGQMLDPKIEQRLKDIPEIIRRLKKIQEGKDLSPETQQSGCYSTVFEKKLSEVKTIGQNGNIAIWQELPDNLPRLIPDCYLTIFNQDLNASSVFKDLFEDADFRKMEHLNKLDTFLSYAMVGLFVIFCVIGIPIFITGILKGYAIFVIILLFAFTLLFLYFIKTVINTFIKNHELFLKNKYGMKTNRFNVDAKQLMLDMRNLLTNGRKTIARIYNIEYIPQTNVEPLNLLTKADLLTLKLNNKYTVTPDLFYERIRQACYIADKPSFKVSYKFNPPDDIRKEDIIHSFITQSEPENHYQEGDPLPILYYIKDNYFEDLVTSMPFPLSELDLAEYTAGKIVDSSRGIPSPCTSTNELDDLTDDLTDFIDTIVDSSRGKASPCTSTNELGDLTDLIDTIVDSVHDKTSPEKSAKDSSPNVSKSDLYADISHIFHFPKPNTGSAFYNDKVHEIINARTMSELDKAVRFCFAYNRETNLRIIPYHRMVLMEPRVYPCHANCILVLCDMAFPILADLKKERCLEAFDVIKEYMKIKPRHLTRKACEQLNLIKYCAKEYGFGSDLNDDFYELLLDILVDPDISIDARTEIADNFFYQTPKPFMVRAYNNIKEFDKNMIKDKARIQHQLKQHITYS